MHDPIDDDETDERVPRWVEFIAIVVLCGFVMALVFSILGGMP